MSKGKPTAVCLVVDPGETEEQFAVVEAQVQSAEQVTFPVQMISGDITELVMD
jgi:hypothetical protein